MQIKKFQILIIVLVIILIGIIFIIKTPETNNDTLKIGVVYSQTGDASDWGQRSLRAAQMAVNEINAQGGVSGKKIELIIEDGRTDPKSVVSAFTKLANQNDIYLVIGDLWDFLTEPIIPLSKQYKKVLIAPTVMNIPFTEKSEYYFSVGPRTEGTKDATIKFFELNPEVKNIYVFCWKNQWGQANEDAFMKGVADKNIKLIGRDCAYFGNDYRTIAAKAIAANPDAIYIITFEGKAIKALRELGYKGKIISNSDLFGVVINKQLPNEYTEGAYVVDWSPSKDFISTYTKSYGGQYPINWAHNSYYMIKAIAQAYEASPNDAMLGIKSVIQKTGTGEFNFKDFDNINVNREKAQLFRIERGIPVLVN